MFSVNSNSSTVVWFPSDEPSHASYFLFSLAFLNPVHDDFSCVSETVGKATRITKLDQGLTLLSIMLALPAIIFIASLGTLAWPKQ